MLLPGGVVDGGGCRREFAFRPITGEIELALAEARELDASAPAAVTSVLAAALASVGGQAATRERVRELAVADRQFLVRRLEAELGSVQHWLTACCEACGEAFDVLVTPAALPFKPAGEGFPFATVTTSLGLRRARTPTGGDQEAIAGIADEDAAVRALARRCIDLGGDGPDEALSDEDVERIATALEAVTPELATEVQTACPACGQPNRVEVDPYRCLEAGGDDVLRQVHALASAYSWTEAEILHLPLHRRRRYLALVDDAPEMSQ